MASRDVTMTGRLIGGRYRLLARRGSGATSAVFTGVDIRDDTPVAVKLLHPAMASDQSFVDRFNATMGQAMNLDHPNLLKVLGFGTERVGDRTYLYVVTEQVTGGSLQDIVDRGRLLAPAQALVVGLAACRGIDHLHRAGIVHADIRPGSILFDADRVPKVADAGLSGLLADVVWREPTAVDLDRARFASPEQGAGEPLTPKTDVYSLALTLVAAITGRVPFVGDSTTATLSNRVGKLLPVSADYGALASPLERAARPDPLERSSAGDLGRGLMQAAANLDRPAPIPIVSSVAFGEQPATRQQAPVAPTLADTPAVDPSGAVPRDPTGGVAKPVLFDEEAPEPAGRSRRIWWALGAAALVAVVAIGALLVTRAMRSASYAVPPLAGLTIGEAQNQIAGNGWEVTVTTEQSDAQPVDHVIRTDPDVGVKVKEGDPFTIVVSSGAPPAPLPDLSGKTVDEATALVTEAGLTPEVEAAEYDETVAQGIVLRSTVPAQPQLVPGDLVQKGTVVQIVPSNGPAPRVMPDMVNVPLDRSIAALDERQLGHTIVEVFVTDDSPTGQPAGNVIAQSIAPKTEVPRGTSVELTVSKGRDLVQLPDLGSLDFPTIQTTLAANGFTLGVVAGDSTKQLQHSLIDGQEAIAGNMYPRGTVVNLVYPEPPAATEAPAG